MYAGVHGRVRSRLNTNWVNGTMNNIQKDHTVEDIVGITVVRDRDKINS